MKTWTNMWNRRFWEYTWFLWILDLSIFTFLRNQPFYLCSVMLFPILFFFLICVSLNSNIFRFYVFISWLVVSSLSNYELCFTMIYVFIFWFLRFLKFFPRIIMLLEVFHSFYQKFVCHWLIFLRIIKQCKLLLLYVILCLTLYVIFFSALFFCCLEFSFFRFRASLITLYFLL